MSISPQTLAQVFDYLAGFWNTDLGTVQSEYNMHQFTVTEDPDSPSRLIVEHVSREDIVVVVDEM